MIMIMIMISIYFTTQFSVFQTNHRAVSNHKDDFVSVSGFNFIRNGKNYFVVSANYWIAMNLGVVDYQNGNRTRLKIDLDELKSIGVNHLRIMASSEGPRSEPFRIVPPLMEAPGMYNLDVFDGLDYALHEIGLRGMTATLCLSNYWQWSGGFAQFISWTENSTIPYPSSWNGTQWTLDPYINFVQYTDRFYYMKGPQNLYLDHIKNIIKRVNKYSKIAYIDDPAIFAWELANEPQFPPKSWIQDVSAVIKELDQNHLVTAGHEANQNWTDFYNAHSASTIDYATVHIWAQNRGIYNMTDPSEKNIADAITWGIGWIHQANEWALRVKKPLILEEFGFPRDNFIDSGDGNVYSPLHPTTRRDRYFKALMTEVVNMRNEAYAGFGFWSYSGEGRPEQKGSFQGDPPHEPAGWYSIYSTDNSTLSMINEMAFAAKAPNFLS